MKSALIFLTVISIVCIAISVLSRRSSFDMNELDLCGETEVLERMSEEDKHV